VVVARGEVWWAELPDPVGSGPGFRRPVIVVQSDPISRSRLKTVVCVPLTSNLKWVDAPGNVALHSRHTGLTRDSVAQGILIVAIDKSALVECTGKLPKRQLEAVLDGIELVLGR